MANARAPRRRIKTDPELKRQLDAAKDSTDPVEAVLVLRESIEKASDPDSVARRAMQRVEAEVGLAPDVVNVLANLGIVIVSAQEQFVRKLLTQPEFASAVANSSPEPGSTPPASTSLEQPPARRAKSGARKRKT